MNTLTTNWHAAAASVVVCNGKPYLNRGLPAAGERRVLWSWHTEYELARPESASPLTEPPCQFSCNANAPQSCRQHDMKRQGRQAWFKRSSWSTQPDSPALASANMEGKVIEKKMLRRRCLRRCLEGERGGRISLGLSGDGMI